MPSIAIFLRERWGKAVGYNVDIISFLIIAEKLIEHTGDGPFVYEEMHEQAKVSITIPAWAISLLKKEAMEMGPELYEYIKHVDKLSASIISKVKSILPKEVADSIVVEAPPSLMDKYKKLHAKINGYTPPTAEESKSLH